MKPSAKRRVAYPNLPQLFLQGRERLMSHFRPILQHFNVTEQQWRVLRALDERGSMEPRELCEACQIHSSSMTGILARMSDIDLVSRDAVPGDQRRLAIGLSARGDALVREIAPLIDRQYRYIEEALGERAALLTAALEQFATADPAAVKRVALPRTAAPENLSPRSAGPAARSARSGRSR